MFKMLVFAMLSSASGWGLPSLLSSDESTNIMGGVDGARDGRQLASGCDRGCNGGCDWSLNTIPFSCDDDCDRGCDGGGATAALAPASGSGLSRCAPRLSSPLRPCVTVPLCLLVPAALATTSGGEDQIATTSGLSLRPAMCCSLGLCLCLPAATTVGGMKVVDIRGVSMRDNP